MLCVLLADLFPSVVLCRIFCACSQFLCCELWPRNAT